MAAILKNPGKADLQELWVSVSYFDGERELRSSAPARIARIPAGDSVPLSLVARQVEKFSRYEVVLETSDRRQTYSGTPAESTPRWKGEEPLLPHPGEARPLAELRGLKWFSRDPLERKEESPGDVPFVRLAVSRRGEALHPAGKAQIMLFDGPKPLRYLNLDLADAAYQKDAEGLNPRTALPESVAYDPVAGELWIGLIRLDRSKTRLRADLTVTFEETGTWEWKGLEKGFLAEPRIADRK